MAVRTQYPVDEDKLIVRGDLELVDRLEARLMRTDTCWLWTAGKFVSGYGRIKVAGKTWRAHRLAYEVFVGPIPEGLVLDHLCRVKHCVRPDHLDPVTDRVNILRGDGWAARNARKTFCGRGHLLDEENTYITSRGGRHCRSCVRENKTRWRQRQKADPHGR